MPISIQFRRMINRHLCKFHIISRRVRLIIMQMRRLQLVWAYVYKATTRINTGPCYDARHVVRMQ